MADYTDDQWGRSGADLALANATTQDLLVLHRQWMWANQQRERFDELLRNAPPDHIDDFVTLIGRDAGHMLVWYGLLWSVIEAFQTRGITFSGRFGDDIAQLADGLRRLRNAVFHVPDNVPTTHDPRLMAFIERPETPELVRRVHNGFGRLFPTRLQNR